MFPIYAVDVPFGGMIAYVIAWAAACLVALGLFLMEPRAYAISRLEYWTFLGRPWKLTTFAAATVPLIAIAPYSGDLTWDYVDAGFMSVLTFATAPWVVGVLYRGPRRQAWVALCLWLLSASWSYDLYLLIKDGYYPPTWLANIPDSSLLYFCAGLIWNLDWRPGRGLTFAFVEPHWLAPQRVPFRRLAWPALLMMLLVVGTFASSLLLLRWM
jgi:hypothetical protein